MDRLKATQNWDSCWCLGFYDDNLTRICRCHTISVPQSDPESWMHTPVRILPHRNCFAEA